jgi:hypothetical protein
VKLPRQHFLIAEAPGLNELSACDFRRSLRTSAFDCGFEAAIVGIAAMPAIQHKTLTTHS